MSVHLKTEKFVVELARRGDEHDIHALIHPYTELKILLPRSVDDIRAHLEDFVVARQDQQVVGCAALHPYGSRLAELRSLAVAKSHQGKGVGRLLVQAVEQLGRARGFEKIFTLTTSPEFFQRLGYVPISRESLPEKVWRDCVWCAKFYHCDEVALWKEL